MQIGQFKDKTVVVSGAAGALGRALCLDLAGAGATIVALDPDEAALADLATEAPDAIDPLPLDPTHRPSLVALAQNWGGDAVDALVHLHPLYHSGEGARDGVLRLTTALGLGLHNAGGSVVVVFAETSDPMRAAEGAAFAAFLAPLAERVGVRVNGISIAETGADTDDLLAAICYLGSPASRGVSGSVLRFGLTAPLD